MSKQDPFLSRIRCGYSETSPSGYPYRVDEGGTAAFNRVDALINLEGISSDSIGTPDNVLPLDKYRLALDEDLYSATVSQSNFLDGDTSVNAGEIAFFLITNYTYTHSYVVTVIGNGSVELSQDIIIYRAPMTLTSGGDGFTIDGRDVLINVIGTASHSVNTPTILYPLDGSVGISINPTIVSTDFSYIGYPQTHLNSSWELALDISFDDVLYSSYDDTNNKTSWVPGDLVSGTSYYIRVKHTGGLSDISEWSISNHFVAGVETYTGSYVNPPIVLSETNADGVLVPSRYVSVFKPSVIQYKDDIENVSLDPIINSTVLGCDGSIATEETIIREHKILLDDFSYTGAKQDYVSTIWEVSAQVDFSTTVLKTTDSTHRRKELVLSNLDTDTAYYLRAKYVGNITGESDWSDVFEFNTEIPYIKNDVTALDSDPNRNVVDPDGLIAYEFGSTIALSDDNQVLCVAQRDRHYDTGQPTPKLYVGSVSTFKQVNNAWLYSAGDLLSGNDEFIYFGDDVSVNYDGSIIAITAPGKTVTDACDGIVYVIDKINTPTVTHEISATGHPEILHFGDSVSLNGVGDKLAIGNRSKDQWDNIIGSIQLYEFASDQWTLSQTFNINFVGSPDVKHICKINTNGNTIYSACSSSDYNGYSFTEIKYSITNGWVQDILYSTIYNDSTLYKLSLSVSSDEKTAAMGVIVYYDSAHNQSHRGSTDIYRGYVDIFKKHTNVDETTFWYKHSSIECSDFEYLPRFGYKVNLNSDGTECAVTGQYLHPDTGLKVNCVFIYKLTGSIYQQYYSINANNNRIGDDVIFTSDNNSIIYANGENFEVNTLDLLKTDYEEHIETCWELSKTADFSTTDFFAINRSHQLLIWDTPQLDYNTKYYVRLNYRGDKTGDSNWSIVKSFDTIVYVPPIYVEIRTLHPLYSELGYVEGSTNPNSYYYGTDISLDGNGEILVIGCPNKSTLVNTQSGAIYIYKGFYNVFNPEENITAALIDAPVPTNDNAHFGSTVCIDSNGENIAVGTPNLNISATNSAGVVYIYHFNIITWPDIGEWVKTHTIEPTNPIENQQFGSSVAFGPLTNIAIGQNTVLGKVSIYYVSNNVWTLSQTLQGDYLTYPGLSDGFGSSPGTIAFANNGNRLFISAKYTEVNGNVNTGVVYSFAHNGTNYVPDTALLGPSVLNTFFGESISCDDTGDKLLVGCPGSSKVYLYEYGIQPEEWTITHTFVRLGDPLDNDYFGTNVAINGLGTKIYIYAHNGDSLDNCVCEEFNYINNAWVSIAQHKPNSMTGVPSDPGFPSQWNNRVVCSSDPEISDHLFVGFPKQNVLGYLEIGNVTQFK